MTSYRRINSRTLNRAVNQQDNMVTFTKPISNAIYPNYFSVPDASNNSLLVSTGSEYSATASPKLTFDATTLAVTGGLSISGNTHVEKLDVSGNLTVSGNTLYYGTITAVQFLPGQVISIAMLSATDLGQTTYDISSNEGYKLFSYSYTPRSATSYILVEYQTIYTLNGSGADIVAAYLYVINANEISSTYQKWVDAAGGGTRSGTIFPIVGRYTNASLTAKDISVDIFNGGVSDTVSVDANNSTWLKITEIGR